MPTYTIQHPTIPRSHFVGATVFVAGLSGKVCTKWF